MLPCFVLAHGIFFLGWRCLQALESEIMLGDSLLVHGITKPSSEQSEAEFFDFDFACSAVPDRPDRL